MRACGRRPLMRPRVWCRGSRRRRISRPRTSRRSARGAPGLLERGRAPVRRRAPARSPPPTDGSRRSRTASGRRGRAGRCSAIGANTTSRSRAAPATAALICRVRSPASPQRLGHPGHGADVGGARHDDRDVAARARRRSTSTRSLRTARRCAGASRRSTRRPRARGRAPGAPRRAARRTSRSSSWSQIRRGSS